MAGLTGDRIAAWLGTGRTMRLALILSAIMLILVPLAPNGWWLAAAFVVFEMSGITWNIVSVSLRQRLIPLGIGLSGWLIGLAEGLVGRPQALTVPIWAAGGLMLLLALLAQRPLQRGLDQVKGRG